MSTLLKSAKRGRGLVAASVRGRKPSLPAEQIAVYQELRAAGFPVKRAKEIAGYKPDNSHLPGSSDLATGSIERQREKALQNLGLSLERQMGWFLRASDSPEVDWTNRIHARKEINRMVPGFVAPAEVKVQSTGIFVEFAGLSSGQLAELSALLSVNQSDADPDTVVETEMEVIENQEVRE